MTPPFGLFHLEVTHTHDLSPSLRAVTFTGPDLSRLDSGGCDQSLSLFLPHPGQAAPVLPETQDQSAWYAAYRSMPAGVRAVMRSYTVRTQRHGAPSGARPEIDIEFALHPDGGPACRWAETARPGDRVAVLGPMTADNSGVRFRPPDGTDWVLLWADETALPAAAAILESLPAGTPARVWLEVPYAADCRPLHTAAAAEITWLPRDEPHTVPCTTAPDAAARAGIRPSRSVAAIRAADFPEGTPYAWIAGEAGTVKSLRRHLVRERQLDRRAVTFVGYWRRGASEDRLRDEAESTA